MWLNKIPENTKVGLEANTGGLDQGYSRMDVLIKNGQVLAWP